MRLSCGFGVLGSVDGRGDPNFGLEHWRRQFLGGKENGICELGTRKRGVGRRAGTDWLGGGRVVETLPCELSVPEIILAAMITVV